MRGKTKPPRRLAGVLLREARAITKSACCTSRLRPFGPYILGEAVAFLSFALKLISLAIDGCEVVVG